MKPSLTNMQLPKGITSINSVDIDVINYLKRILVYKRPVYVDAAGVETISRYVTPTQTYMDIHIRGDRTYVIKELAHQKRTVEFSAYIILTVKGKKFICLDITDTTVPIELAPWLPLYIQDLLLAISTGMPEYKKAHLENIYIWRKSKLAEVGTDPLARDFPLMEYYENKPFVDSIGKYYLVMGKTKRKLILGGANGKVYVIDHPIRNRVKAGNHLYLDTATCIHKCVDHNYGSLPYLKRGKLIGGKIILYHISPISVDFDSYKYLYVIATTVENVVLVGNHGRIELLKTSYAPEARGGSVIQLDHYNRVLRIINNPEIVGKVYEKI